MSSSLIVLFAACILFMAVPAGAKPPADAAAREKEALRLKPNTNISVVAYDKKSGMFILRIDNAPAVGPNVTTLEWLLDGIENESNASEYKRHPERLVGSQFHTKKTLWLLNDAEIVQRKSQGLKRKK